ncbi:unnamed protein product [Spodoptera exigua]|nr:unnamed protein product [Spodoptera exigua]
MSDSEDLFNFVPMNQPVQQTTGQKTLGLARKRSKTDQTFFQYIKKPVTRGTDRALKYTMSQSLKKLRRFRNIKLLRIHLPKYSNGTLVQSLLLNGLKNSSYPEKHTADILKMLTLNKYGGVALETNMIVLRSLNDLPQNWILKRNEKYVAPGLMGFSKSEFGLNVTSEILKKISETYNSSNYYVTGRAAIEKVVQGICPIKIRWNSCKEMMIFPAYDFYSVENILRTPFDKIALSQVSFSFHLKTLTRAESPFVSESIIRIFCPSIFWEFQQNLTY